MLLSYLIGHHAVLQRGQNNRIWGTTAPNKTVHLELIPMSLALDTVSDAHGDFSFVLSPQPAGGPFTLKVDADGDSAEVSDIYFGDVFLLSGQSNMELPMERLASKYPDEVRQAENTQIRFFAVPENPVFGEPQEELTGGQWQYAVAPQLNSLSGLGYFFAKERFSEDGVAIGLIQAAIGGTPINAWLDIQTLQSLGEVPDDYPDFHTADYVENVKKLDADYHNAYLELCDRTDIGLAQEWRIGDFPQTDDEVFLNKPWPTKYTATGVVWLTKTLAIPPSLVGLSAVLNLGTLTDADQVYVNGLLIGSTDYKYPPRHYPIESLPANLTLVIRLRIYNAPGGITPTKAHTLQADGHTIDVDECGPWKIKRTSYLPERAQQYFPSYDPACLWNGMIYPLRNLSLAGILWYQGESDTGKPHTYGQRLRTLIRNWRALFGNAKLPFLYVQLPNFGSTDDTDWADLRMAQSLALDEPYTAMAVTLGDGEDDDLHPLNKSDIARKLNLALDHLTDYPSGYCTGPLALAATHINDAIVIQFETFGKALKATKTNTNTGFILSEGGRYYWLTEYQLEEDCIKVDLPNGVKLGKDSKLAYCWNNAPVPFIFDDSGFVAAPFELAILQLQY